MKIKAFVWFAVMAMSALGCTDQNREKETASERDQRLKQAELDAGRARRAAESEQRERVRTAECTEGIEGVKAEARRLLAGGEPGRAWSALRHCQDVMTDPAAITMLAKADRAADSALKTSARGTVAKGHREGVHIGMTQQQVLASSWGRPDSVNRTVTAAGSAEQWVYGTRNFLYFRDGRLEAVQN